MSELSAEEKKRILRERRQAKMKLGQASARLNSILGQGGSVNTATTSVLDKEPTPSTTETVTPVHHDDDPEVQEIDSLPTIPSQQPDDFDAMLQQVLGGQAGGAAGEDPFAQMMKMFQAGAGGADAGAANFAAEPQDTYSAQLRQYQAYQHKTWKVRFLVARYLVTITNFWWHYTDSDVFRASLYSYVRGLVLERSSFVVWFLSLEVVLLTTYFVIGLANGLFDAAGESHWLLGLLRMGSLFSPQVAAVVPVLTRVLGYYELLSMFVGDGLLVVFLFGLTSVL